MQVSQVVLVILAIVPSIILHEVAHGWVADFFGDHTARRAGRLSLDPTKHVDLFGTIIMPLLLIAAHLPAFGYAKPVPVNTRNLRKPRNQSVYVSLAGPATNIFLSAVAWGACRVILHSNPCSSSQFLNFFAYLGIVNVSLAALNLLPIPPLDGSALIERLVPSRHLGTYFRLRGQMLPFVVIGFVAIVYLTKWSPFQPLVDAWLRLAGFEQYCAS